MNKLISIVVTVYNKEIYLGHCFTLLNEQLLELSQQDRDKIELLIINDCSTDNSMELINALLSPSLQYRVINNEKRMNIAYVRWQAVNEVTGKYFIFIDADDLISEDYIKILLDINYNTFTDLYQFKGREYPNGVLMDFDSTWSPLKLVRTAFVRKHDINFDKDAKKEKNEYGIEAVLGEDLDFFTTINKCNPIVVNIDKILVTWNFAIPDSLTKINYDYIHWISKE